MKHGNVVTFVPSLTVPGKNWFNNINTSKKIKYEDGAIACL